jgi:rhamnopyranosyl-N-acetylglucosaminyl-diphospho-decaprenol beta-1,3/1,4-galactofuranosyltransferase
MVMQPPPGDVVGVVLAHSRAAELDRVLQALADQTRPPDHVFVVDSDATPEVREVIERWRAADDRIEVVDLGRNGGSAGGFAAGLNAAAKRPGTAWIAAFDDDATPALDAIELVLGAAAELDVSKVGAIGAASQDEHGEMAWSLYVEGHSEPARDAEELKAIAAGRKSLPVSELAWHALLFPVEAVRRVGPPREELFMWYEDVEYGWRLRRAGLGLHVVPEAVVHHRLPKRIVRKRLFGVPLEVPVVDFEKSYLMTRNALVVQRSHGGAKFWWAYLPLTLARAVVVAASLPGSPVLRVREAILRPFAHAARGRLGPPPAELLAIDRR